MSACFGPALLQTCILLHPQTSCVILFKENAFGVNEVSVFGVWGVLIRCGVMTFAWPKGTFMHSSHGEINRYC